MIKSSNPTGNNFRLHTQHNYPTILPSPPAISQEGEEQTRCCDDDTKIILVDCTVSYIRELTTPPINPPSIQELKPKLLLSPWKFRIPVDTSCVSTCNQWKSQVHTSLFHQMFEWNPSTSRQPRIVKLHPYFHLPFFSNLSLSPFISNPSNEIAICLLQLLFRRVGCRQKGAYISLHSHGQTIFLATGPGYIEQEIWGIHINTKYYLLRCHYDGGQMLTFGYHCISPSQENQGLEDQRKIFKTICKLSIKDIDFRLKVCVVLTNMAQILNSLIDFGIPLTCEPIKRCIVDNCYIQKVYKTTPNDGTICGIPGVTVQTMIGVYNMLEAHKVRHTDKLFHAREEKEGNKQGYNSNIVIGGMPLKSTTTTTTCFFGPIGRSYPPKDIHELLDALVCVAETLVAIHNLGIMHRDIRWGNIFHALKYNDNDDPSDDVMMGATGQERNGKGSAVFTNEWVLFDFEFAAISSPQPSFGKYTLTTTNNAPEMFTSSFANSETYPQHTVAVDIWALGYLIQTANVDIPSSHKNDLETLRQDCMAEDPKQRPSADQCLETLRNLYFRKCSGETDLE